MALRAVARDLLPALDRLLVERARRRLLHRWSPQELHLAVERRRALARAREQGRPEHHPRHRAAQPDEADRQEVFLALATMPPACPSISPQRTFIRPVT